MIYLLPFIAAITGWVTNWIAVKMLFHPRKPINLLGIKIQGVFPKRQLVLAERLGEVVAKELFSIDDLIQKLEKPENTKGALSYIEGKIDEFIQVKLPSSMPMMAMFLNDDLKAKIKNTLLAEIENMLPGLAKHIGEQVKQSVKVEEIVYEKVANFSSDKFEEILFTIMKKEFKLIEILGGILGFLIGIIQLILVTIN
jgi:uncharacterized membrane protein YheB (UPF0754 family)